MKNVIWRHPYRILALLVVGAITVASLGACSAKALEPFKDASVSDRNDAPAVIGTMPDGFNNWAFKCNGTTGVYTLYHSDSAYGGIAAVAHDGNCTP